MPSKYTNGSSKSRHQTGPHGKKYEEEDENDLDDLDFLGTAALEQFELTQHAVDSQTCSVEVVTDRVSSGNTIPVSRSISQTRETELKGIMSRDLGRSVSSLSEAEVTVSVSEKKPSLACSISPTSSVKDLEERVKQLQEKNFVNDGEVKVLRGTNDKYLAELRHKDEQLNQLQAQFSLEKRQMEQRALKEKEGLLTRLQFKEQELRSFQEKNAELESRQKHLESPAYSSSSSHRVPSKSQPVKTSSRSSSKKHRERDNGGGCSPSSSKPTDFLSTETFMSLSQLRAGPAGVGFSSNPASSVEQRVVGGSPRLSRRGSGDGCKLACSRKERRGVDGGKLRVGEGGRSRSISPVPSDTKKMKRKSMSDKDRYSGKSGDLDDLYGINSGLIGSKDPKAEPLSSQSTVSSSSMASGSSSSIQKCVPDGTALLPVVVPGRKLDGSQLLLLLSRHELLKPPFRVPITSASPAAASPHLPSSSYAHHHRQPLSHKQTQGSVQQNSSRSLVFQFPWTLSQDRSRNSSGGGTMTGLLSLLSLESKLPHSLSSSASFTAVHSTPLRQSYYLASPLNQGSASSLDLASTVSPAKTPSRRPRLLPSKPHTLARTNPTQSRVGRHQSSNLLLSTKMKSASASNTPEKPRPLGVSHIHHFAHDLALSRSLVGSIDMRSLHSSIANLWTSSEALRFSSSSFSLIGSRDAKQKGRACEMQQHLGILRQVGNFIVRYHEEQQQLKMQPSSLQNSSYGDGSYDSFDATFIAGTRSPSVRTTSSLESLSGSSSLSSLGGLASGPLSNSQQFLGQALSTLETLVTYSETVREQILAEPPEFVLDSRSLSSVSAGQQPSTTSVGECSSASRDDSATEMEGGRGRRGIAKDHIGMSMLAKVSHKLLALQESGSEQEVPNSVQVSVVGTKGCGLYGFYCWKVE